MLPPFEHMLRNAVVHGLETPAERIAAGKPETGRITMSLQREGAEVVITVEDDGAGLDVAAIRAKARQMGLLQPGMDLTDEESLQLVLEPGLQHRRSAHAAGGPRRRHGRGRDRGQEARRRAVHRIEAAASARASRSACRSRSRSRRR